MTQFSRLFLTFTCCFLLLSWSATSWSQDMDFGDEPAVGEEGEGTGEEEVVDPNALPLVITLFAPVDDTSPKILELLNDALFKHVNALHNRDDESKKVLYEAISGLALQAQLDVMESDERDNCLNDPSCISEMADAFGAQKIVIGNIFTEGRDRPQIMIQLIDVSQASLENVFEFDASKNLKRQQKELNPAVHKLFKLPFGKKRKKSRRGTRCETDVECGEYGEVLSCEEQAGLLLCLDPPPGLSTSQLVGGLSAGIGGLALIGTGVVFGLGASDLETEVKDGIKANTITQVDASNKLSDADGKALIANVFFGVGTAAIITGVVLFILEPSPESVSTESSEDAEDAEASIDLFFEPQIGLDGGGFIGGFHF